MGEKRKKEKLGLNFLCGKMGVQGGGTRLIKLNSNKMRQIPTIEGSFLDDCDDVNDGDWDHQFFYHQ
jgi:hypothetical protein